MLFTWIFMAIGFTAVILVISLWLIEAEEEHNEEVALHEHSELEQEAIELAQYNDGSSETVPSSEKKTTRKS